MQRTGGYEVKLLNIYGQEAWHTEARIIGSKDGLLELRDAIEKAIKDGKATTSNDLPLFASDGEGYEVIVEMHNDEWGCNAPQDSFWNTEGSNPQYIMLERQSFQVLTPCL